MDLYNFVQQQAFGWLFEDDKPITENDLLVVYEMPKEREDKDNE